jgi:endoglucanase
LNEANPEILIIIEGINWIGLPVDGLPHGRPTLTGAYYLSHTLMKTNKLVYSAHFYGYTGPNHSGAVGIGETHDPRYRDLSAAALDDVVQDTAGYVALNDETHFTRPIWISEFGVEGRGVVPTSDADWFDNFLNYLQSNDLDFAFWPLVGFLENGVGNGWALMNWNRQNGQRDGLYDGNDWRADRWREFMGAWSLSGPVANSTNWRMLNTDQNDYVKSRTLVSRGDWDSGARKAACPDDLRLIGLSRSNGRGLCTDATYGNDLWNDNKDTVVVTDQRYVSGGDWAGGYTKLQCPQDHYVIGYAKRGSKLSSVICAASKRPGGLGTAGRTMWFDRGDARGDGYRGGEFAISDYKGQCSGNEYIAGVAFSTKKNGGSPAALFCRS